MTRPAVWITLLTVVGGVSGCGLFAPSAPPKVGGGPDPAPVAATERPTEVLESEAAPVADVDHRDEACGTAWATNRSPEPALTMRCMNEWLTVAYGGEPVIDLDPVAGNERERGLTAAELRKMANHIRPLCPSVGGDPRACDRAIEYFERAAAVRFDLFDGTSMTSFEPVLAKVLRGEPIARTDLQTADGYRLFSDVTLWRLRNAVFARHGRSFKHPDLQHFFHGDGAVSTPLLPVGADASYSDDRLTATDKANLRVVQAIEGG